MFVPHIGCSHKCSFCNQNIITGKVDIPHSNDVVDAVQTALKYIKGNAEIAFFGGSFTAIDREYMLELLDATQPYIKSGKIDGIRVSTRPDYIDDEILSLLKEKGVTSIELGAQSMDDEVLRANLRGHTADDVIKSSNLIKEYGFSLGLQMMTGLYKSTVEKDKLTAIKICELKPETVRIYPTAILKNTALAKLYEKGEYIPYSFDTSLSLCSELLDYFESNGIKVIRLGLHDSDSLKQDFIAGVYHPSFRELCVSKLFFRKFTECIKENGISGDITVYVNPKDVSYVIGQSKENIKKLNDLGYKITILQDKNIDKYNIKIEYNKSEKGKCYSAFKIFGNTRL